MTNLWLVSVLAVNPLFLSSFSGCPKRPLNEDKPPADVTDLLKETKEEVSLKALHRATTAD